MHSRFLTLNDNEAHIKNAQNHKVQGPWGDATKDKRILEAGKRVMSGYQLPSRWEGGDIEQEDCESLVQNPRKVQKLGVPRTQEATCEVKNNSADGFEMWPYIQSA